MLDLRLIASIILIPLQNSDDTSAALGGSLADIAAFMQEVEIRQGSTPRPDDGRGIDRAGASIGEAVAGRDGNRGMCSMRRCSWLLTNTYC